ncbi:MAG: hypothetical protein WDN30_06360 [Pararobbsia sp.]
MLVAELLHLRLERIDRGDIFLILLDQPLIAAAKEFFKNTGNHRIVCVVTRVGAPSAWPRVLQKRDFNTQSSPPLCRPGPFGQGFPATPQMPAQTLPLQ